MLGQFEALQGDLLTSAQKSVVNVDEAVKSLAAFEKNESMNNEEFKVAHARIKEL